MHNGLTYPDRTTFETAIARDALEWERFLAEDMYLVIQPLNVFLEALEVLAPLVMRGDGISTYM